MPIYEYICLKCNNRFALLQSMSPAGQPAECPKCSSGEVKKLLSSFSCAAGAGGCASHSHSAPSFGGGGGG